MQIYVLLFMVDFKIKKEKVAEKCTCDAENRDIYCKGHA